MPYSIDRFNGTTLTVVDDGTIDSTLDIKLIGKNYAGYGEAQNENFLHLLEHFSNPTAPPKPVSGQIWYNSSTKRLNYYTGVAWKTAGADASPDQPVGQTAGDLWFKTTTKQLFVNNGTDFTLIGPEVAAGFGTTQMRSKVVSDIYGGNHAIIECIVNDETTYVISKTDFRIAPNQLTTSSSFDVIKEGITLPWTKQTSSAASNYGVTDFGVDNEPKFSLWGTASNSLRLNGKKDTDFATAINTIFPTKVRFYDPGFTVGNDEDLAVYIDTDATTPIIKNSVSSSIRVITNSSGLKYPVEFVGKDILPGYDKALPSNDPSTSGVNNIGSSARKFNVVWANAFNGVATNSNALLVNTDYITASILTPSTVDKRSIVSRDADGDITARVFKGLSERATEADKVEIDVNSGTITTYVPFVLATDGYNELKVNENFIYNSATNTLNVNILGGAKIAGGEFGAVPYQTAPSTTGFVIPNSLAIKKYFTQVGNGSVTSAPYWGQILSSFSVKRRDGSFADISVLSN
jgi:hypothetical protein